MDDFFSTTYLLNCTGQMVRKESVLKHKDVYVYLFASSTCKSVDELLLKLKIIYDVKISQPLFILTHVVFFQAVKKRHAPLEIIYIPSDTNSEAMLNHFKNEHHGWYALPAREPTVFEMQLQYNITHEPQVVVVRKDGTIVTRQGKADIMELGINVIVKWCEPYVI